MWLSKRQGGCQVGAYTWENDGDVVEVDDHTGTQLLRVKGGDYTRVEEPAPAKPAAAKKAAAAAPAPAEPA